MEVPRTRWSQEWGERDIKHISALAVKFRSQGALNDLSAWRAAEIEYVNSHRPVNWRGQIHVKS